MFPPASKSTTMPSVGEIMETVFWNHTNVFIMDFLDICYPSAMCTSKSEQIFRHQDICYPTFWNCFPVCDRTNNFLIVCLVQLWSTCCLKRLVLSHNLSEISNSWIKRGQLDVTCFIISLFNAQHVLDVNTSILRSLRLICWVISWVVLLWFDVCWCYVVVCLGWCGICMQAEALQCLSLHTDTTPHHPSQTTT